MADEIKENDTNLTGDIKNTSDFDKQLEALKNGNLPDSHVFNLGKPSIILQNCGFPPNDRIELAASRLRLKAGQGNHLFDIMDIKGLDKALHSPVAVFEYGDMAKSQNIIVNLKKDDKNFLVGVFFNQHQRGYEVSDIRGLFNRDNIDWLRWIQQGKMIYGNKDEIQVLAAQQRTNLAEVNSKEARTSSDSYYLDSVDNILHKFGDVKDIYTIDFPEYKEQKERFNIFKQFRTAYLENDSINVYDAVREADEFYDALKAINKSILKKYTDGIEKPELSNAATDIFNKYSLEKSSQVQEKDINENNFNEYIHSSAFIERFGDWEKVNRLDKLKNTQSIMGNDSVIIDSVDVSDLVNRLRVNYSKENLKQLQSIARDAGRNIIEKLRQEQNVNYPNPPSIQNADSGKNFKLQMTGINEIKNHDIFKKGHIESISSIPDMIRNGIFISTELNEDGRKPQYAKFHYYAAGYKLDNEDYTAKIVFTETKDGELFYDQNLSKIEKGRLIDILQEKNKLEADKPINRQDRFEQNEALNPLISQESLDFYDKRLINICQVPQMPYMERNPSTGKWQPTQEAVELVQLGQLYIEKHGQEYMMIDLRQKISQNNEISTSSLESQIFEKSSQVQEVDLSYYYDKFMKEAADETEDIQLQKALAFSLDKNVSPLIEVELNRENWSKLFPTGTLETPIGTVKLGENQFEKIQKTDRNNLLAAMYETLSNPAVILEKETLDEKTGEFRPVNVYGKSFIREDSNHKRAVESVIIFKDGENISISTHNKNIKDFVKQIKTADQIIFADSEISRVTSLILQNGGSHVRLQDAISNRVINSRYDKNNLLSIKDLQFSNADVKKDTDKSKTFDSNSSIILGKTILPSFAVIADKTLHSVENAVVKSYDKEKKSYLVDNGTEKLELPKATFDTLFNDKLDKDRTEAKIAEGRTIVFRNKEMGIQGTVIPEFAMYTQKGLETFKDCVPVQYNKSENTYTISNEKTSITISAEQFREITSPERFENKFDENTPAWKKLCEQQYKDFFQQRDNTAYNFRHNLSVYCRKEAGSPCDALHLAKEIISRMSAEEQKQTKKLLKSMAHEGESTNELIARVYHEAIKGQPLNEDYIKKYEPNSFIKRPFYDTISENGQKIEDDPTLIRGETDRNLKIGMSIKNVNIETDKLFGKGKDALHFDSLKVISASKETNTITLVDSNKSYFKLPRDTVLAHYKEQQMNEMKIEQRHNRSNSMNISYS